MPLVQFEVKSLAQDNDYYDAISDLHEYEKQVPRLFIPGLLNVATDTTALRYGAVGAEREFYPRNRSTHRSMMDSSTGSPKWRASSW
jgi:type I restriction enzyme R subunit